MSRHLNRTRTRRRPSRKTRPSRPGFRTTPFFWILIGVGVMFVMTLTGVGIYAVSKKPTVTPTLTNSATPTLETKISVTFTITPTITMTPIPTELPKTCTTIVATKIYSAPEEDSVTEQTQSGESLTVVGIISQNERQWYRIIISDFELYIPVEDVKCGGDS